jgi:hypothetical protein
MKGVKTAMPWEPKLLPYVHNWLLASTAENIVVEQGPNDVNA